MTTTTFCNRTEQSAQISCATPQFHRAWTSVFGLVLQASHLLSSFILFLVRFTRIDEMLQQARQSKTLILVGTFSPHSTFHTLPPTAPLEHSVQSSSFINLHATWYPVLTEYSPNFSASQNSVSRVYLQLRGTRIMALASSRWKLLKINSLSHHLETGSISSATLIPSSIFYTGSNTLFVGEFGSQAS